MQYWMSLLDSVWVAAVPLLWGVLIGLVGYAAALAAWRERA